MTESEERLKRIEILLETCAKVAVNNQAEIKELREQSAQEMRALTEKVDRNTVNMAKLTDMFIESMQVIKQMQSEIRDMQSEIRGIQTENKRMLDHLFGKYEN